MKTAITVLAATGLLILTSNTAALAFPGSGSMSAKPGAVAGQQPAAEPISGKVVETMDSGGYTYIHLDDNGKKTWVAVPKTKVKVGEMRAFMPGNVMNNFESKSLKRKFDTIVFSPGPLTLPGTKAEKQAQKAETAPAKVEKVKKASGKNAQTVADCYKKSAKLNNKSVSVRGKVVKVSKRIMGKNWVHLQDGSGDPKKGSHDLVVTTMDEPNEGDTVTATGTLVKDKDFGYGYKYDVILEDAKIKK